jgi:chromosome partitioning protein
VQLRELLGSIHRVLLSASGHRAIVADRRFGARRIGTPVGYVLVGPACPTRATNGAYNMTEASSHSDTPAPRLRSRSEPTGGLMQAISVINFKGGVGKTTLTANLGVELARRGFRVLLIDLDPQCSLTFSFFSPDDFERHLRGRATMKCWLDGFRDGLPNADLVHFFRPIAHIHHMVGANGGFVQLVPSDLDLASLELDIMRARGPRSVEPDLEIARRRGALALQLRKFPFADYDFVLLDCPPSLGILTQSALIASDHVLIPTVPDYLSYVGISSLVRSLNDLQVSYNGQRAQFGLPVEVPPADPRLLGVVFNMVTYNPQQRPIADQQFFIDRIKALDHRTFTTVIRDSNRHFGRIAPKTGPAILNTPITDRVYIELMGLATEFLNHFPQLARRAAVA